MIRNLIILLYLQFSLTYDQGFIYNTNQTTAMDIHYSSQTVIFASIDYQINHMQIDTRVSINKHQTSHKATITSIAVSSDGSLVLTGSRDYTAQLRYMGNGSLICRWNQLRGKITGTTILSDIARVSFVSQQGYLYYGFVNNCTLNNVLFKNYRFTSITSLSSGDQVWITDYSQELIIYDISTKNFTTFNIGSDKLISVMNMENTNYIGICSRKAFMILNRSASILHTLNYPAALSKSCRIMPSSASILYLTATTEVQSILIDGNDFQLLWNIWKINITSTSVFKTELVREQENYSNRYVNSQVIDAGLYQIDKQFIQVVSLGQGYSPYQNIFGDGSSYSCDTGSYDHSICQLCINQVQGCQECDNSGKCQICLNNHYLAGNTCDPCPDQCYSCLNTNQCEGCQPGYFFDGSDCLFCNITECVNCQINYNGIIRCWQCAIGYFTTNFKDCMQCQAKYPGCLQCDYQTCSVCDAGYVLVNTTTGICQKCSHYFQGCAACISDTYCETCYETYPYFDTISLTNRTCKQSCKYDCLTCDRFHYDQCGSCDVNRTLSGSICTCISTEYILDNQSLKCLACSQYIQNCINCTSYTYCQICDPDYKYQTINGTNRGCKECNYTCQTCSIQWDICATCNASDYRVLSGNLCVCLNISYFQYGNNTACQECIDHLTNCITCLNQSFCLTCKSGFYLNQISAGNIQCTVCQSPCTQCFGSAKNCTQCANGRQLNHSTNKCECLDGQYSTGITTCGLCRDSLGFCKSCTNNSVCLSCWQNYFFQISGNQIICAQCQDSCLTCNKWTNSCASCNSDAKRTLNTTTFKCDCETGYIQTYGSCLNCAQTFTNCTSCNLTHCFSCDIGFSLAYGGLKCVECTATYHGCTLCINGVCAACNQTQNFQLSYSMCICKDGYYWKNFTCTPYKMGQKIRRYFPVTAFYDQSFQTQIISIKLYFSCKGLKFPYGLIDSIRLYINKNQVNYNYTHHNQTVILEYIPTFQSSKANFKVQLVKDKIFDINQYQAKTLIYNFNKNIYYKSERYTLASNFKAVYQNVILILRWIFTIVLLLGCADTVMSLIFISHTLPAFLFLDLSIPPPLHYMLSAMMKIHQQSLFILGHINLTFQPYDTNVYQTYGIQKNFLQNKITDCITLIAILVFYGIIGNKIADILPSGKFLRIWQYKFIQRRYSTIALSIFSFAPAFILASLLNFQMQSHNTNQIVNVGISIFISTFLCVFVFFHFLYVYFTQIKDQCRNQDCYMGASQIQQKSPIFVVSLLIVFVWTIPILIIIPGIGSLPLIMCILLWNIFFFKNWSLFPNKGLFFIKLFISVMLLFQVIGFLVFQISQNYLPVPVPTLQIIGLCLTVNIIILLLLSSIELVFLFILGFIRFYRSNSSTVEESLDFQNQSNHRQNYQRSNHNRLSTKRDSYNLKNKKQHLKKFIDDRLMMQGIPKKMDKKGLKEFYSHRD